MLTKNASNILHKLAADPNTEYTVPDDFVDRVYHGLWHAEHANSWSKPDNTWIRTTHEPVDGSTAFGPIQITGKLLRGVVKNDPDFYAKHKAYIDNVLLPMYKKFSYYGREPQRQGYHVRYDYGGYGDAHTPEMRAAYEKMSKDLIRYYIKEQRMRNKNFNPVGNANDLHTLVGLHRFGYKDMQTKKDIPYFKRFVAGYNRQLQNQKAQAAKVAKEGATPVQQGASTNTGVIGAAPVKPAIPTQQQIHVPQRNTQNTPVPPAKQPSSLLLEEIQKINNGDTIWSIFKRHSIPWNTANVDAFMKHNKIKDPKRLNIGQFYQFPAKLVDTKGQEVMADTAY